jgi:hypothetical protein
LDALSGVALNRVFLTSFIVFKHVLCATDRALDVLQNLAHRRLPQDLVNKSES